MYEVFGNGHSDVSDINQVELLCLLDHCKCRYIINKCKHLLCASKYLKIMNKNDGVAQSICLFSKSFLLLVLSLITIKIIQEYCNNFAVFQLSNY